MILDFELKINNSPSHTGVVEDKLVNTVVRNLMYAVEFPNAIEGTVEKEKLLREIIIAMAHYNQFEVIDSDQNNIKLESISEVYELRDGMIITYYSIRTNTGTMTLKINSAEPKPILNADLSPVSGNTIQENQLITLRYNEDEDSFIIVNTGGGSNSGGGGDINISTINGGTY